MAERAKRVSGRRDRVNQGIGVREACLEILPLTKSKKVIDAIFALGRLADEVIHANDGFVFGSFEQVAGDCMDDKARSNTTKRPKSRG